MLNVFSRICAAALLMGVAAFYAKDYFIRDGTSGLAAFAGITAVIGISVMVYLVAAYIVGVDGVRKLGTMLVRRRG